MNTEKTAWLTVLTLERDGGDPVVVRQEIVDSAPESVARKAVFRGLAEVNRTKPVKWQSAVLVIERLGSMNGGQ
jgi:hypothetical protein